MIRIIELDQKDLEDALAQVYSRIGAIDTISFHRWPDHNTDGAIFGATVRFKAAPPKLIGGE